MRNFKRILGVLAVIILYAVVNSDSEIPNRDLIYETSSSETYEIPYESTIESIYESTLESTVESIVESEVEPEESSDIGLKTDKLRAEASDIPEYQGTKNLILNNNKSGFVFEGKEAYLNFSPLDSLNRVGYASALLTPESYVGSADRAENSNISNIKPTGWKNKRVDKSYIYNRSHLIGYAFFGKETDSIYNLMTGTAQFNQNRDWGMLHYETLVQEAVKNGKTVMYEVNPVFRDNNLLAVGVQMRALSDDGELEFNVFIYNVQDNLEINYANGESVKK